MLHDRDTAYSLYSVDADSVPTLAHRIGQTVPDDPFKNFPKLLTPEAEKWRSRQILLRPEAEKPQFRQDWLSTVQNVPVHFEGKKCSRTFFQATIGSPTIRDSAIGSPTTRDSKMYPYILRGKM